MKDQKCDGLPNYIIKRKRISKKKSMVVFARNNIQYGDLKRIDGGFVREEKFRTKQGYHGTTLIIIKRDNLDEIFDIKSDIIKVRGNRTKFNVVLNLPDQKWLPLKAEVKAGCITCRIFCDGRSLEYDRKDERQFHQRPAKGSLMKESNRTYSVEIPDSVLWSASHPYQAGGMSPKCGSYKTN